MLTVIRGLWKHHPGCCTFKLTHFRQVDHLMLAGKARLSTLDAGERRVLLPRSTRQPVSWEPAPSSSVTPCLCSETGLLLEYRVASYDTLCEYNTTRNNGAQAEPGCVGGKLSILYVNNSYCKYKIKQHKENTSILCTSEQK